MSARAPSASRFHTIRAPTAPTRIPRPNISIPFEHGAAGPRSHRSPAAGLINPRSPARPPATPRPDPPARRARTPAPESGRSAHPPATTPPSRRDAAATYAAEDPAAYAAGSRRELIRPLRLRRLTDARRLTLTNGTVAAVLELLLVVRHQRTFLQPDHGQNGA